MTFFPYDTISGFFEAEGDFQENLEDPVPERTYPSTRKGSPAATPASPPEVPTTHPTARRHSD